MRIMIFMNQLYKESGNNCRFSVSKKDDLGAPDNLVYSFPKHWRYTQAVNHRLDLNSRLFNMSLLFLFIIYHLLID